jgi:hypothetical protein
MQPHPYAPYPNAYYPNANGAQMPVRYMIPNGYRQNSPPFANQSFDRYASMPAVARPPQYIAQPVRYPPGYRPGFVPPGSTMMPVGSSPRPQQNRQSEHLQTPQQYYYNPYGPNGGNPGAPTVPPKKGAKEYKDNAFTIAPDGAHSETIKGLVSNNDINDLLKHKGTKVKVSKIYRITKTKPDIPVDDSSDEDLILPTRQSPQKSIQQSLPPPPPPPPIQRPISSSSSDSHCSTCSNCSCSDCRDRRRSHVYDDCPECRAEFNREQVRRQRRR